MRWFAAAALGIVALAASGAGRSQRHFLAVSATSYNSTTGEPPGEILLYDRDTLAPIAKFDFPAAASAPAVTADGTGLYVSSGGGVAIIDLITLAIRSFLSAGASGFTLADDRILLHSSSALVAIDLAATRVLAQTPCPGTPSTVVYDGNTGYTYATMVNRNDLCVATPGLDPAPPLATPLAEHEIIDAAVLLDRSILLVTTYAGGIGPYKTYAIDLATGRSAAAAAIDGIYPLKTSTGGLLYGSAADGLRAYQITYGSDGFPVFSPAPISPAGAYFTDDRFAYSIVAGYCSTPEGPVTCPVGFRVLDPATLVEDRSLILAQQTSFGLFAPRGIGLELSAPMPFSSTASPPKRSRK